MDGNRWLLAFWIAALCAVAGTLGAQALPDIDRFEVENVRLILLDAQGTRRGVLKGDSARRQRDGAVKVEGAELRVERPDGAFVVTARQFEYTPATNAFNCPEGFNAQLPGGGTLIVPAGKGTLEYTDGVRLKVTVVGEALLDSGPTGESLVQASITNPEVNLSLKEVTVPRKLRRGDAVTTVDSQEFRIESLTVIGDRGGECTLRLAQLPTVAENQQSGPSTVSVGCFGDVSLTVTHADATLHMLRRARMAMADGQFEVTSNQLAISGRVSAAESAATALTDIAIDAEQNVSIQGETFDGRCGLLRYREYGARREVRLETEPSLNLDQGETREGLPARLELRARDYVDVLVPDAGAGSVPAEISTELAGSANLKRLVDGELEWQINGSLVRLFSVLDEAAGRDRVYSHSFDAFASGYSPLLRVAGVGAATAGDAEVQRASVFGARGEGSYVAGQLDVRVYGPEVVGVVYSDAPLCDLLRVAVGIKQPDRDLAGDLVPVPLRDGRLTIRASTLLDLKLNTSVASGDVALAASGSVQLDHEPLPRDDANLVTLTGATLGLEVAAGTLRSANLQSDRSADALATLGFDLLICRSLNVAQSATGLASNLGGPGRMIIRDAASVDYFTRELNRLPKSASAAEPPRPDAAWLDFGGTVSAKVSELARSLEIELPDFQLVRGEFEQPRAGRTAVNDLAELVDPLVSRLYRITCRRIYATSLLSARGATPVNLLRLEGDARVDSRMDGVTASAGDAIELSGSENQAAADAPFAVVLLGSAELLIEDAGLFFGDYVRSGVFAYDGSWKLTAAERLEVTMRPIESGDAEGATLAQARQALSRALLHNMPTAGKVHELGVAVAALKTLTSGVRPAAPGADQPWEALPEAIEAAAAMRRANWLEMNRDQAHWLERESAGRAARRARALLSVLIDVAGKGGLRGTFYSASPRVPALNLAMQQALFTFDGLGQVVDVAASGPIMVSRGSYTITGLTLTRGTDGTLTLDGASITLPPDTGVEVSGVTAISLKQREDAHDLQRQRTMVTRVRGRKLSVGVKLSALKTAK